MYFTEGIILRKSDAGEADLSLSIYTRDFGKVHARAQGAKKEGAKLRGHLETLSRSAIGFVLGRNGERLTHASLIEFWPRIRLHYEKCAAAYYCAALIDGHCLPGEKDEATWQLLLSSFARLEGIDFQEGERDEFVRGFEREFLSLQGYGGSEDLGLLGGVVAPWPAA